MEARYTPRISSYRSQTRPCSAWSACRSALLYLLCANSPPPRLHVTQHLHRVIEASRRLHLRIARFSMNGALSRRVVHDQHAVHIRMEVRPRRQCAHSPDLRLSLPKPRLRGRTAPLRRREGGQTRDRGAGSCVRRSGEWRRCGSTRRRSTERRAGAVKEPARIRKGYEASDEVPRDPVEIYLETGKWGNLRGECGDSSW